MMKWTPWPTKKLHVRVKPLRLEGLRGLFEEDGKERVIMVETKWKGPKSGFVPFSRNSSLQKNYSSHKFFRKGDAAVEWDDEFESVCSFSIVSKEGSLASWFVSFNIAIGEDLETGTKLANLGKVSLDLGELASNLESPVKRKLPISLQVAAGTLDAALLVRVSFAEIRSSQDLQIDMDKGDMLPEAAKKVEDGKSQASGPSPSDLEGKSVVEFVSEAEVNSCPSSEEDSNQKSGFFSWKRRKLSFKPAQKKNVDRHFNAECQSSSVESLTIWRKNAAISPSESENQAGSCDETTWEVHEIVSRDGKAKLKASVFFASFDQRSEKAAGESACAAVVAVIAHWLHSNSDLMPTKLQFDSLIIEGSSEWRKLCENEAYQDFFPDKHFDLDTVLEANVRPLVVRQEKSFVGFFSPEKFESLKGAMSFDEIWSKISSEAGEKFEPSIYIISWNDHFFVLKLEADAIYMIDSLGERLSEGCNRAFILRFDDLSLIYGKVNNGNVGPDKTTGEETDEVICSGKECCREFIKRFLASISLGELEEEEHKGPVSYFSLHQRLQIEFHYSSFLLSSTSSSYSSSSPETSSSFSHFST